jgi:BirA family biotin operon repressor/biotin-[acetyl-CoA-carboxylase] ligase
MIKYHFIKETTSTNALLWQMLGENKLPEGFVLQTDFQTAGKGQIGNYWESMQGQNLLFSILLFPRNIKPEEQFIISQLVSIAIKKCLDNYLDDITVKWPNDIYWKNKKLAGILIENSLQGAKINFAVVGIGLNVNQMVFESDAPNPVSIKQILGRETAIDELKESICENIMHLFSNLDVEYIRTEYFKILFWKNDYHTFSENNNKFQAQIFDIHPDGKLELETSNGEYRSFYFKEVKFEI